MSEQQLLSDTLSEPDAEAYAEEKAEILPQAEAAGANDERASDIERLNREYPFVFLSGQARVDAEVRRASRVIGGEIIRPWLAVDGSRSSSSR